MHGKNERGADSAADTVLIFKTSHVWGRIVSNLFKISGVSCCRMFDDFSSLIRYAMEAVNEEDSGEYMLAAGAADLPDFLASWESMKKGNTNEKLNIILEGFPLFFIFENPAQAERLPFDLTGTGNTLFVSDDPGLNAWKVRSAIANKETLF